MRECGWGYWGTAVSNRPRNVDHNEASNRLRNVDWNEVKSSVYCGLERGHQITRIAAMSIGGWGNLNGR